MLGLLAIVSCDSGSNQKAETKPTEDTERKLAGVYPEHFDCQTIVKEADLTALLGAVSIRRQDAGGVTMERGLPKPCAYIVTMQDHLEGWTYDIDCRSWYKTQADKLFEQYRRTSAEKIEAFDAAADAGIKPNDSGVEVKRPEPAFDVDVGAKGLDHHGQGLLFIDDDAPCYVRVVGPDAARRLALSQTIVKNLTFMNAPMTPRAADKK